MSKPKSTSSKRKVNPVIVVALIGLAGTICAALIAIVPSIIELIGKNGTVATATETSIPTQQVFSNSTPIPRFDKIFEINFSSGDNGLCITDDSKVGGYDTSQDNYYVFGKKNGYITYCNASDKVNQGSLEIRADPSGSPDYFGYGVLMGFIGGEQRNLCSFEIIHDFSKTKVVFGEYINNKFKPTTTLLEGFTLDTNPHILRMVVFPDSKVIGYLDDIKIAEHTFAGCSEGRVGFVAYGQGDDKIIFDDLKLYAIP